MKKNERITNISSFPLKIHGNKSKKTFKRAEIASDIQCSTLKNQGIQDTIGVSKYRKWNGYTYLKSPFMFCFQNICIFHLLWVWHELLYIMLFCVPNINEIITGSNFKWFLPIVYTGQVYLNIEKEWQDSWMTVKYFERISFHIFAVKPLFTH